MGFKSAVFNLSDEKNAAFFPFEKKFQADLARHDFLRVP